MFLSRRQCKRIFDSDIRPLLDVVPTAGQPTAHFVIGAPGSGKTTASRQLSGVRYEQDDLFRHHPGFEGAAMADDLSAFSDQQILSAVARWDRWALSHIVRQRANFVMPLNLTYPTDAEDLFRTFKRRGYKVDVTAVVVHSVRSRLATLTRYAADRQCFGYGTWVQPEFHDLVHKNMDRVLEIATNRADTVHERNSRHRNT
ncbi:zeta toxin family protein [Actinoallomurus liliacearum]|uniref:zeta toxin family protein n=1 Tax=Actinoallomurus liliacearum TaxID=1080073 RepID=UPI003CD0A64E